MNKKIRVAIDGPVGSGKSTVARLVAKRLGLTYIDTGAMYRGIALKAKEAGVSWDDSEKVAALAVQADIELSPSKEEELTCDIRVDGKDVSRAIRQTDIGQGASKIGTISAVRRALVAKQRLMTVAGGIVMEGRDIGTVVIPDAELKIFLSGSVEERAKRRFLELQAKGQSPVMEKVIEEVKKRDEQDSTRADSPLKKADDGIEVDTTNLSIDQVVDRIVELANGRMK
jgi:cytidylate kinase